MIQDMQEYLATRHQIQKFEEALEQIEALSPDDERMDHTRREVYADAFRSQLETLRQEAAEYEALLTAQESS
jgi:hypothetical protein